MGVLDSHQKLWKKLYPNTRARWIEYMEEKDLPAIISAAFCLAQPSTAEGYGYPPLEAMACGVLAVVSSIPVLIEVTGGHALYANPSSPQDWLENINGLDNEATYGELAERGLKWAMPLCGRKGWSTHVADMHELIVKE